MRGAMIALGALLVIEVALAASPITEGEEGTTADMWGNIVWAAMPATLIALIAVGIVWLVKRKNA
jgi:hypothetical protein